MDPSPSSGPTEPPAPSEQSELARPSEPSGQSEHSEHSDHSEKREHSGHSGHSGQSGHSGHSEASTLSRISSLSHPSDISVQSEVTIPSESPEISDPSDSTEISEISELSEVSESVSPFDSPGPSGYAKQAKYPRKSKFSEVAGPSGFSGQSFDIDPSDVPGPSGYSEHTYVTSSFDVAGPSGLSGSSYDIDPSDIAGPSGYSRQSYDIDPSNIAGPSGFGGHSYASSSYDVAGPSGFGLHSYAASSSDVAGPSRYIDPSETAMASSSSEPEIPQLVASNIPVCSGVPSQPPGRIPRPTSFIIPPENDDDFPETSDESKVRSYPCVRGQWTTFIYGEVSTDLVENLMQEIRAQPELTVFEPDEIHLTLVRGHYALCHHQIYPFLIQLEKRIQNYSPVAVCLSTVKLFENEKGSRCFIVLCEKTIGGFVRHRKIVNAIEETLDLFSAKVNSTFAQIQARRKDDYDDYVFHTSLAWCLPERRKLALALVDRLNRSLKRPLVVRIEKVKVHIGNKMHCIPLDTS